MFPNWKWYASNQWKYENKLVQWLMRYPLSFMKDGFHFTKSLSFVLLICGLSYLSLPLWALILVAYTLYGVGFNGGYHT